MSEDKLLGELLDPKHFKKLHHSVVLRNLTSGLMAGDGTSTGIVELKEEGIVLKVAPYSIAKGHMISLLFMNDKVFSKMKAIPQFGRVKGTLELLGRVNSVDQKVYEWVIEIEFTQFDAGLWKKFFDMYQIRQTQINSFTALTT